MFSSLSPFPSLNEHVLGWGLRKKKKKSPQPKPKLATDDSSSGHGLDSVGLWRVRRVGLVDLGGVGCQGRSESGKVEEMELATQSNL